jgi:hypothetical protein
VPHASRRPPGGLPGRRAQVARLHAILDARFAFSPTWLELEFRR